MTATPTIKVPPSSPSEQEIKILHLTDIHIGGSLYSYRKDLKALQACFAEIEHTHPDFVVVTGDLCFPMGIMSLSLNNTAPVGQFAAFMRNLDIPWAFTYGNHDTESLASADQKSLNDLYKSLSFKTSGTLLYPYIQPDIMVELGSTTGTFCGHDHYNNMSLEYKGIRLTYGMSIDYLAMPGIEHDKKQRGAELITLHKDGSWDLEQIPLETIVK